MAATINVVVLQGTLPKEVNGIQPFNVSVYQDGDQSWALYYIFTARAVRDGWLQQLLTVIVTFVQSGRARNLWLHGCEALLPLAKSDSGSGTIRATLYPTEHGTAKLDLQPIGSVHTVPISRFMSCYRTPVGEH
jgi:hypothetical protein